MTDPFELKTDRQYEFTPFVVPKYQIKFANVKRLANLSQYMWYTPAPIYLWGRYTDINLSDIVSEYDIKIYWYRFNKPVFKGLTINNDPSWNHMLWACDASKWKSLVDGVLESVQFNTQTKTLYTYALQELFISDPLQADTSVLVTRETDKLKVHAFCPLTNLRQIAFNPNRSSHLSIPDICSLAPSKKLLYRATRLFENSAVTQDNAFEFYKKLLESEADYNYELKVKEIQRKLRNG